MKQKPLNNIFIVWPEQLSGRKHLAGFYIEYIRKLSPDIYLNIILKNKSIEERLTTNIKDINPLINISVHEIPEVMDIWIRDWAPLPVVNDKGEATLIKAIYRPAYIKNKDLVFADGDDLAGRKLSEILKLPLIILPLILDFGNFTNNGKGTGIVTERILKDNPEHSKNEIENLFSEIIGITKLIIIPEEPGDVTGHVDGTIRFITPEILAISQYPEKYTEENKFLGDLEKIIINEMDNKFRIIRIMNGPIRNDSSEGIGNAWGNHMNYFIAGNKLYLPCYGIKEDELAKQTLKNELNEFEIISVDTPEISKLAMKGGVLNCMSWCIK